MIKVRITSRDFKDLPFDHLETVMPVKPEIGDILDFLPILGNHLEEFATKYFSKNYEPKIRISSREWWSYPDDSVLELEGPLLKTRNKISYNINPSVH